MAVEKRSSETKMDVRADSTEEDDLPEATILRLCKKNEWGQADSILRVLAKGAPEVDYSLVGIYTVFTTSMDLLTDYIVCLHWLCSQCKQTMYDLFVVDTMSNIARKIQWIINFSFTFSCFVFKK